MSSGSSSPSQHDHSHHIPESVPYHRGLIENCITSQTTGTTETIDEYSIIHLLDLIILYDEITAIKPIIDKYSSVWDDVCKQADTQDTLSLVDIWIHLSVYRFHPHITEILLTDYGASVDSVYQSLTPLQLVFRCFTNHKPSGFFSYITSSSSSPLSSHPRPHSQEDHLDINAYLPTIQVLLDHGALFTWNTQVNHILSNTLPNRQTLVFQLLIHIKDAIPSPPSQLASYLTKLVIHWHNNDIEIFHQLLNLCNINDILDTFISLLPNPDLWPCYGDFMRVLITKATIDTTNHNDSPCNVGNIDLTKVYGKAQCTLLHHLCRYSGYIDSIKLLLSFYTPPLQHLIHPSVTTTTTTTTIATPSTNNQNNSSHSPSHSTHASMTMQQQTPPSININAGDIDGATPLLYCVKHNSPSLIPLLLQYRADVYSLTKRGKSIFEHTMSPRIFHLLIQPTPSFQCTYPMLSFHIHAQEWDMVSELLTYYHEPMISPFDADLIRMGQSIYRLPSNITRAMVKKAIKYLVHVCNYCIHAQNLTILHQVIALSQISIESLIEYWKPFQNPSISPSIALYCIIMGAAITFNDFCLALSRGNPLIADVIYSTNAFHNIERFDNSLFTAFHSTVYYDLFHIAIDFITCDCGVVYYCVHDNHYVLFLANSRKMVQLLMDYGATITPSEISQVPVNQFIGPLGMACNIEVAQALREYGAKLIPVVPSNICKLFYRYVGAIEQGELTKRMKLLPVERAVVRRDWDLATFFISCYGTDFDITNDQVYMYINQSFSVLINQVYEYLFAQVQPPIPPVSIITPSSVKDDSDDVSMTCTKSMIYQSDDQFIYRIFGLIQLLIEQTRILMSIGDLDHANPSLFFFPLDFLASKMSQFIHLYDPIVYSSAFTPLVDLAMILIGNDLPISEDTQRLFAMLSERGVTRLSHVIDRGTCMINH